MTGPTFLAGQTVALNALLFRMRQKAERLIALHKQRRELGDKRTITDAIDGLEIEINGELEALNARHRLLKRSTEILNMGGSGTGGGKIRLISKQVQAVEGVYTDVNELQFLDYLSRSVVFFPDIDASDAPLRRNMILDQLLERDGLKAYLYRLAPQEAALAGNALTDILYDLYGPDALIKAWNNQVNMPNTADAKILDCDQKVELTPKE